MSLLLPVSYTMSSSFLVIIMLDIVSSGTDSIIECMHGESLPEDVVKMYCYIQVTKMIHTGDHNDTYR